VARSGIAAFQAAGLSASALWCSCPSLLPREHLFISYGGPLWLAVFPLGSTIFFFLPGSPLAVLPAASANMSPDRRLASRLHSTDIATQLPTLDPPPITRQNSANGNVTFNISPNPDGGITVSGSAADTARVLQHYLAGLAPGRRGTVTESPTAPKAERNSAVTVNFTTCLCCEKRFDAMKTTFWGMYMQDGSCNFPRDDCSYQTQSGH
jgi:hypothetical protein